ncbi:unnamed protein product [Brassicogethes aeneus]|uniref:THAP-type domain-containing protein n=1 Tax=Brassicogethes aeneus TaxID=1431903 RepID=A0A9P0BGE7_BRAAE|nr:unnamed protein product [Brassicogethes aeneus]
MCGSRVYSTERIQVAAQTGEGNKFTSSETNIKMEWFMGNIMVILGLVFIFWLYKRCQNKMRGIIRQEVSRSMLQQHHQRPGLPLDDARLDDVHPECAGLAKYGQQHSDEFPKDPNLAALWKAACGYIEDDVTTRINICSKHFNPDDYLFPQNKYLKSGAIPTLYLPHNKENASPNNIHCPGNEAADKSLKCEFNETNYEIKAEITDYKEMPLSVMPLTCDMGNTLQAVEQKKREMPEDSTPNSKKNCDFVQKQLRYKIKKLQQDKRRLLKRISSMNKLIEELKRKALISEDCGNSLMEAADKSLKCEFNETNYEIKAEITDYKEMPLSVMPLTCDMGNTLQAVEQKKREMPEDSTPNSKKNCDFVQKQLRYKIKKLQQDKRRLLKRISSMNKLIEELKRKALISEDCGNSLMMVQNEQNEIVLQNEAIVTDTPTRNLTLTNNNNNNNVYLENNEIILVDVPSMDDDDPLFPQCENIEVDTNSNSALFSKLDKMDSKIDALGVKLDYFIKSNAKVKTLLQEVLRRTNNEREIAVNDAKAANKEGIISEFNFPLDDTTAIDELENKLSNKKFEQKMVKKVH